MVCIQHFLPEQIKMKKNKPVLLNNAIPTEFLIECIDIVDDEIVDNEIVDDEIEDAEFVHEDLYNKILRQRLNFEIREHNYIDTIKKQSNKINELTEKLRKTEIMVTKLLTSNKKLEKDLLQSQTSTDVTVNIFTILGKYKNIIFN